MMHITFEAGGATYRADVSRPISAAIAVDFHGRQTSAFHIPAGFAVPVEVGAFVGDVRRGGSCNCEQVSFSPHAAGTHTECVGHLTRERLSVHALCEEALLPATVLTVEPETVPIARFAEDLVVTRRRLQPLLDGVRPGFAAAILLRTLPNDEAKRSASYSATNPPYLDVEAVLALRERGVRHLVVDLPSIDREKDGGRLAAHRAFFGLQEGQAVEPEHCERTVTELAYLPSHVPDGCYLLNLQVAPFVLDAAPSRPILFPVEAL